MEERHLRGEVTTMDIDVDVDVGEVRRNEEMREAKEEVERERVLLEGLEDVPVIERRDGEEDQPIDG